MIEGLKPYPEYRDSGIPWVGNIPQGWGIAKLRHCGEIVGGVTPSMSRSEFWNGDVPWVTPKDMKVFEVRGSLDKVTRAAVAQTSIREIPPRSVLLVVRGMILARRVPVALTRVPVTLNQDMKAIVPFEKIDGEYLARLLDSAKLMFDPLIDEAGHGTKRLPTERWRNECVPVPSLAEQRAIARFLDHADRRIQRYIREKRKLIALLNEQKQAIIHRAVTRGLDPNPPMRDSGVPWVGRIPSRWEVMRCGRRFRERVQVGRGDLPILTVSLRTGVTVRDMTALNGHKQVMADRAKYKVAMQGDLAYNMMRMWQGAVGVAPCAGLVSPAYVVATPFEAANAHYYELLFRTKDFLREVNTASRGIVMDRNRLYWDGFKQIMVPVPPAAEQAEIVASVRAQTATLDKAIAAAEREIALLREYRARLIADVVTGQLDVRAAAASLPELDAEEAPLDAEDDGDEADEGAENDAAVEG